MRKQHYQIRTIKREFGLKILDKAKDSNSILNNYTEERLAIAALQETSS